MSIEEITKSRVWSRPKFADNSNESTTFIVVSYNILSEQLLRNSSYFNKLDERHWRRRTRHLLLMRELECIGGDILCLQEVDRHYWEDLLGPELQRRGFSCVASWRQTPPVEGVVTCVRSSEFEIVGWRDCRLSDFVVEMIEEATPPDSELRRRLLNYSEAPQRFAVARLRHKRLGLSLTVGNLHVSYQRPARHDLRAAQVVGAASDVVGDSPCVLCGDFNSTPDSLAYSTVVAGDALPSKVDSCQELLPTLLEAIERRRSFLESAYRLTLGREPDCTLNLTNNSGCVDFVLFDNRLLDCRGVLEVESERIRREKDAVPDGVLPSDHLSLAAAFSFRQ